MVEASPREPLRLRHVGVLTREPPLAGRSMPLPTLERIFERIGAQVHHLNPPRTNRHPLETAGAPHQPAARQPAVEALDLVLALGGDGTVLKALDRMPGCPVLGINFGRVGFLSAGEHHELEVLIERLLAGDFLLSERLLLQCVLPESAGQALQITHPIHAVNEVVLRTTEQMLSVDVILDGEHIRTIRGDGVIVGTPTGSTGYLLSTGAPVVMPTAACFILDGLNEYNFSSRAIVLAPEVNIELFLQPMPKQQAQLIVDGSQLTLLGNGDRITLRRSQRKALLIYFRPTYFFHNLRSRLSWQ